MNPEINASYPYVAQSGKLPVGGGDAGQLRTLYELVTAAASITRLRVGIDATNYLELPLVGGIAGAPAQATLVAFLESLFDKAVSVTYVLATNDIVIIGDLTPNWTVAALGVGVTKTGTPVGAVDYLNDGATVTPSTTYVTYTHPLEVPNRNVFGVVLDYTAVDADFSNTDPAPLIANKPNFVSATYNVYAHGGASTELPHLDNQNE